MNLEKILSLLRSLTSPEATLNGLSALSREDRQATFRLSMERLEALRALEGRTPDQNAEASLLLGGCEALKRIAQTENDLNNRFAALGSQTPATPPVNLGGEGNPREQGRSAVGTDLVQPMRLGNVAVDHEGAGMSERAFRAACEPAYRTAFWRQILGRADRADLQMLGEVLALQRSYESDLDAQAGYITPPQLMMEIVGPDAYPSGLLDIVRTIPTTSSSFKMFKNTYTGSSIYNSPFRKTRTSGVGGPDEQAGNQLGMIEVTIHEAFIKVNIPKSTLEDNVTMLQAMVTQEMRESYRLGTEAELSTGTGVGEPEGILTNAGSTGGIATYNVGASASAQRWMNLYREVPPMYRAGAELAIADAAYQDVESVQTTDGLFPFAVANLQTSAPTNGPVERYRGKPIAFCPFYPEYSSTNKVATFGAHKRIYYYGLRLASTLGVRNIADESFVTFVLRIRDGGKVVLPQAGICAVATNP